MADDMLMPLPPQPATVPWPTADPDGWPLGSSPPELDKLVDELIGDTDRYGTTYAAVVIHGGRLLLERYGGALPHFDRPPEPVTPTTPLLSWSMAKSVLHAGIGLLVDDGLLELDAPAPVPAWHTSNDDPSRHHHARTPADDARRTRFRRGLRRCGRVGRHRDVVRQRATDDVAGYAEARTLAPPARHALQLLVGHVEHRRRHRGSMRRAAVPRSSTSCGGACSSPSA